MILNRNTEMRLKNTRSTLVTPSLLARADLFNLNLKSLRMTLICLLAEGTRRCPGEIWSINNDFSKKSIAHTSRFALSLTQPHFSTFPSNHYTIHTLQQLPTFSATLSLYWPILAFSLQISAHLCTILDYTTLPPPLPYATQCLTMLIET